MTTPLAKAAALGLAISVGAAAVTPAAAAQSWGAVSSVKPTTDVVQVHMKKHRFEKHGNYAYYNGYRGTRHHYAGYSYYNGYWFPPVAFLALIIGGAFLLSH